MTRLKTLALLLASPASLAATAAYAQAEDDFNRVETNFITAPSIPVAFTSSQWGSGLVRRAALARHEEVLRPVGEQLRRRR